MNAAKRIILWLVLAIACLLPASALTPSAPENRIWEIFSTGYDAAGTPLTIGYGNPVKPTSAYDQASILKTGAETRSAEAERSLFGKIAEFKAAEEGTTLYRGVAAGTSKSELYKPTIAPELPKKLNASNGFSATNTRPLKDAKLTCIKLNSQTTCPPRAAVPVNPEC